MNSSPLLFNLSRIGRLSIVFVGLLSYFVFGSGWYEPSHLTIQGQSPTGKPVIQVSWDSGAGFNTYEKREFKPVVQPLDKQMTSELVVGGTGRRHGASMSDNVVCVAITVDGKEIDLSSLDKNVPYQNGGLSFDNGKTVSLSVRAEAHIGLTFKTSNFSGIAFVSVNGVEDEYNLYMSNVEAKTMRFDYWLLLPDGSFKVDMDMPRYAINTLKVKAVNDSGLPLQLDAVKIEGKGHVLDLLEGSSVAKEELVFSNVLESMRSYYDTVQFIQQVFFALITIWLLGALGGKYKQIGSFRACLVEEKRFVFWIMFGSSFFVFSLWLVAFWPGVMSVDSLKIWRAAMLPNEYLNDHPVLNVFLYKYFFQLWGEPVVVPVAQILSMSLLLSWFFFWLYRKGVALAVLIPCILFILTSVPVGTFTIMLWKDIPFAILVTFWGCLLAKLFFEKRNNSLKWTGSKVTALILLGLALGLIRHNGIVYFAVLPVLFVALRLVPLKRTLFVALTIGTIGAVGCLLILKTNKIQGFDYVFHEIGHYLGDKTVRDIAADSGRVMKQYPTILNHNKSEQQWDKFHYYLNDRYAYWFLLHSGWWEVYPYKNKTILFPSLQKVAMKIYDISYKNPWDMVAWNPVWLLFLLPVVTLLFWYFPHTAILGVILLAGTLPLVYLKLFNWRYYYFLYLGMLFIIPLMALDLSQKKSTLVTE